MTAMELLDTYLTDQGLGVFRNRTAARQAAMELDWALTADGQPDYESLLEAMGSDAFNETFITPFTAPTVVCVDCGRKSTDTDGWTVNPPICPDCLHRRVNDGE